MEKYVGKRILYQYRESERSPKRTMEGICTRVSPNGEYVKISGLWETISDIRVIDVLGEASIVEQIACDR